MRKNSKPKNNKLKRIFNILSGKRGVTAAAFGYASILGIGAAIVTGVAAVAVPVVPIVLVADATVWAVGSRFHARRYAKKKGIEP